jgi:hypothetical protein
MEPLYFGATTKLGAFLRSGDELPSVCEWD